MLTIETASTVADVLHFGTSEYSKRSNLKTYYVWLSHTIRGSAMLRFS